MSTTLTKPTTTTSGGKKLLEDRLPIKRDRVDVEAGVIYDVKIVGLESRNVGRTIGLDPKEFGDALNKTYGYSKQALEAAIPMYEGAVSRIDHPASEIDGDGKRIVKSNSRPALATFGQVKNVRLKEDGLYGDLHLIKSHPSTAFVLEVAEKMPDKLALSHNAYGVPTLKNGRAIIDQILEVYSVDIVGDKPGTTNGLFESFSEGETVKKTIKQIFESLPAKAAGRSHLIEMMDEEMDGSKVAEMEVDMPAEANTDDQVKSAFRAMVMAAFDDDSLDAKATVAKIKDILAAQDKLAGKEPAKEVTEMADDKYKGKETQESLADKSDLEKRLSLLESENQDLKLDKHARALLETAEREVTDVRLKAVKSLTNDSDRKQLIESWPKKTPQADFGRPRTSAPLMESQADEKPLSGKELISALKRK